MKVNMLKIKCIDYSYEDVKIALLL